MISVEILPPSVPLPISRRNRRSGATYVSLSRELIRQAVALTSEHTYQGYFRCWKLFYVSMGPPGFLLAGVGGDSYVRSLLA